MFPLLRQRCPAESPLVDRLEAQHVEALALLQQAQRAVTAWEAGDGDAAGAARDTLESLRSQLVEHLDTEEASVLRLCAANLSPQEWGALPGHAMANYRGDKIWLILGLIRERMNDEQRAAMLEHMPPPAQEMWTGFGEQAFNELSAEVALVPGGRG